jgi:hypothetical protein
MSGRRKTLAGSPARVLTPRLCRIADQWRTSTMQLPPGTAPLARDYRGAGWIGFDPVAFIEIPRIANAIGNAAAQSSAMTQNARGPRAP